MSRPTWRFLSALQSGRSGRHSTGGPEGVSRPAVDTRDYVKLKAAILTRHGFVLAPIVEMRCIPSLIRTPGTDFKPASAGTAPTPGPSEMLHLWTRGPHLCVLNKARTMMSTSCWAYKPGKKVTLTVKVVAWVHMFSLILAAPSPWFRKNWRK